MARLAGAPEHRNRLADETSPYLLQHAHNPVDWYPWGPEALARAAELDRPIFLSIGYAACHWCHVMERESFEDETTAAVLNERFVAIKVDREERPDLDQLYMGAVQAMTGQGGWPMSVFLTPDGRPFFGGTYFPDTPRHGMPSFRQVLEGVHVAWTTQRSEIDAASARLVQALAEQQGGAAGAAGRGDARPGGARPGGRRASPSQFDAAHGGWGRAPKFPQPMTIEFLLRRFVAAGDERALTIARASLDAMAAGGIHDQLGGGFHRYSTDARWLVPHFEQMLYDNAQLARVYAHAWALTGDRAYRDTAIGVLDYLLRELRTADGGFAASQDADTEGVEGATFVWSAAELRAALAEAGSDPALFAAAYGVTDEGNWEGSTILSRVRGDAELGGAVRARRRGRRRAARGVARGAARAARAAGRSPPATTRCSRPGTGSRSRRWRTPSRALGASGEPDDAGGGRTAIARRPRPRPARCSPGCVTPDGRLRRSWKDGRASADGVLEDHACLADGLLALYEATHDERWYREAVRARRPRAGAVRRPGRRVLRHGRRRRGARRAAEGRPGQRDAVGQRDGDDRAPAARGADRRGPLPRRPPSGRSRPSGRCLVRYPDRLRAVAVRARARARRDLGGRARRRPGRSGPRAARRGRRPRRTGRSRSSP